MGELTEIYEQNAEQVFKYLMVLCRNADVAEELTQETFYQAVRSIDSYNGECKMSVWLCQIAKHTYYKFVDKQVKQPQSPHLLNQLPSVENKLIEGEDKIALYRTIHLLEEPYKEIVLLRILGGLSFKEIGEIHLKNENWARVTFYRAKLKLRERGSLEILTAYTNDDKELTIDPAIIQAINDADRLYIIAVRTSYHAGLIGKQSILRKAHRHQAEGFAGGELKHGTIALIEEGIPVFALATRKSVSLNIRGNVKEVVARGAHPCIISIEGTEEEGDRFVLPPVHELLTPIVLVVPLQLIAYYASLQRGCDVEKPRNLAKSVTVE